MYNSEQSHLSANPRAPLSLRSKILLDLWDELAPLPTLADVADIQIGIASPLLRADAPEIFSDTPADDFTLGLSHVSSELEPYIAKPSRYLHGTQLLQGRPWQERWSTPKVITNATSTNIERWPII
jgi:hypothetical protein